MRKTILNLVAASVLLPAASVSFSTAAEARHRHHYYGASSGHRYCRHSPATTGAIAGGVGGAVIGSQVLGHGLLGAAAGGVGGLIAGKAIDRSLTAHRRCYYR